MANQWSAGDEINVTNLNAKTTDPADFTAHKDEKTQANSIESPENVHGLDNLYRLVRGGLGPNNKIIYDAGGFPSAMVFIPRFNWDPINEFASADPHPAFIVDGATISGFWVSKYQCVLIDASGNIYSSGTLTGTSHTYKAASWPGMDPRVYIDWDAAKQACLNKNGGSYSGWHLLTNAEWYAIALWCLYNSLQPLGNNNYGRDVDNKSIVGRIAGGNNWGSSPARWLTGSGGPKTSHDGTPWGIFDLNGNIWEWVDGLKLVEGKIYIHGNANTSPTDAGNSFQAAEANWYDTGRYINWDGTSSTITISSVDRGTTMEGASPDSKNQTFESITGDLTDALKKLCIAPHTTGYQNDRTYWRNFSERLPLRGGSWGSGAGAGLFALYLDNLRSSTHSDLGFRAAYVEL